ncbi:MAG: serine/threonine-protein kinase [Gemmatimonadota bacterium]|nr:serine/threonine-protein kinase [Gemmatimonadota bacterium]
MPDSRSSLLPALAALLDEALDATPGERDALITRVRAEHPALADELEALLGAEPELDVRQFLAEGVAGQRPATTALPLEGHRVGAYTLLRALGQGGMGNVWLARRSDGRYDAEVAVKVLNLALLDRVGVERFRREGSALARLTHPNIARLVDAGVVESGPHAGQPYLVLERVDGVRIDRYCDEHRLDPAARIELVRQVLAAVSHSHANLLVHRDIKPSNILVTTDGTVKLLDFGIAKLLESGSDAAERTELTERGGVPFTPEYAAPEQVAGDPITTATDVYALGVLLYLLLAGRHPTAPGTNSTADHLQAVLDTEPARLSTAVSAPSAPPEVADTRSSTSERLRRMYRGDLDNILAKALRKNPADRYQTAAAFSEDLSRFLRHEPVSARADSIAYRTRKFLRRNRGPVVAATGVVLALIAATTVTAMQMVEARRQRDDAVRESRRADAQIEFQNVLLSHIGDRAVTMREVLDAGRGVLEQQATGDPRLRAALLHQLSENYRELGDTPTRQTLLAQADSLARAVGDTARLADVLCDVADAHRRARQFGEARQVLEQAERLAAASDDLGVQAGCAATRSILADDEGRFDEGLAAARRAVELRERLGDGRTATLSSALDQLAILAAALESANQPREAAGIYRRVIAAMDSSGRGGLLARAITTHNLALVLGRLGEMRDAEALFHEVMQRFARNDPNGPVHVLVVTRYAEAALAMGHADSALKYFDLVYRQVAQDTSTYWHRRALFGRALAQVAAGRLDEAENGLPRLRGLDALQIPLRPTEDLLPDPLVLEAAVARGRGDTVTAGALARRALAKHGFVEGNDPRRLRAVALLAAEGALAAGEAAEARDLARRARVIATVDSLASRRSMAVGEALLLEALALVALQDTAGARDAAARARAALEIGAGTDHPGARRARELDDGLRPALARMP